MAKIIKYKFGKLVEAKKKNGESYDDWRSAYLNLPGLIVIAQSENKAPGKYFLTIYINDPDSDEQRYFQTSLGDLVEEENYIRIHTENSIYVFEIKEGELSDEDKELLYLNVFCI